MKIKSFLYTVTVAGIILVAGCQNQEASPGGTPTIEQMDLASLKQLLAQKQSEADKLQSEIDTITKRMASLDPSISTRQTQRVTAMTVADTIFNQYITAQGLLEADETISVNAETTGRLIELNIDEGDYVEKGDLVAVLDLEQLNRQMAELETSYQLAEEVFQRQKRLWDQNIGSEIQYLQAKNEKERLEKSMATLEFQQSKGKVYAPLSGVVDEVNILEGELVSAGAPIAVILDVRQYIATADLAENYLGKVRLGDVVTVRFPSLDTETKGKISYIGNTIDKANRTFRIEVKVGRVARNLKPNMLVEVQVNINTIENVVTVPINIIQQEINGKEYLMIVDRSEGKPVAKKTYITKGNTNDNSAVITSGLVPGDEVILVGGRTVNEGSPLEIIDLSVLTAPSNEQMNE